MTQSTSDISAWPVDHPETPPRGLAIGGVWRAAGDGGTFDVRSPATGDTLCAVADATAADGLAALDAACAAQPAWAAVPSRDRSEILRRAFEALMADVDGFARVISAETGKPPAEARGEVAYAAGYLRWFAEEAVRVHGRLQAAPEGGARHLMLRRPVGSCLLITPWNFPLAMVTRKVGPALAAGCTVVLKPAEATPLTASLFVQAMEAAGVPAGVLNLIPTTRSEAVVAGLLSDHRLRKLSFTGSTRVGRRLLAGAAERVLRCSMELGGNAPFIVFADADLEAAVEGAMQAKLRNAGQACTAANRFLVHDSVAEDFVARLSERFAQVRLGELGAPGPSVGPLISHAAREAVHGLVRDAVERGATRVVGGEIPDGPGWYYPPTLLDEVPADAAVMQTEIFGPVAPVHRFRDEEQAIELANATEHGLAAYAYTRDLARGHALAERLDVGMLGLNTGLISDPAAPFGGVKQSGLGREGGREGIEEYLSTHYTAVAAAA